MPRLAGGPPLLAAKPFKAVLLKVEIYFRGLVLLFLLRVFESASTSEVGHVQLSQDSNLSFSML